MRELVGMCALLLLGCESKPAENTTPTAATTASASAHAAPAASSPPLDEPKPLDLEALKKSLKCSGKTSSGPCPVLEKFETCREGWSPITQSGDGRWFGVGALVKKGQFIEDYIILRSRRVPLEEVANGALGVKIAIDRIPEDEPEARSAAGPAARAFERADTPKKGNLAVEYVSSREKWPESFAQQAGNNQVYVAAGAGAYMCPDPKNQDLHVVKLSGTQEHPADGIYATIHPVKW